MKEQLLWRDRWSSKDRVGCLVMPVSLSSTGSGTVMSVLSQSPTGQTQTRLRDVCYSAMSDIKAVTFCL